MTLEQVLNKYDRAVEFYIHEKRAEGIIDWTIVNYKVSLDDFRESFVNAHKNDTEVNDPGYRDFQVWRDELAQAGKSSRTIKIRLTHMRQFFNFCCDDAFEDMRFYEINPVSKRLFPSMKKEKRRPYDEILTDEQVMSLWKFDPKRIKASFSNTYAERNYAIIIMFLATEIRNAELLDLKLSDLDFEFGEIQIHHGKGDKYRCVDFPEIAQIAVKMYLQSGIRPEGLSDDDYLFGTFREKKKGAAPNCKTDWHRGSRQWLSETVCRYVKAVTGVDDVRSHDLRHVGARLDLHNGMRAEELQAKLGHSHFQTTQIYCGRLGTTRKRTTAKEVYAERDAQCERNKALLGAC